MTARPQRWGGLTLRLTAAIAGVALAAVLLVGAVVAPLLHNATEDAVREPLARQATLLAQLPPALVASDQANMLADQVDLTIGRLLPDGSPVGPATALSEEQQATLLAGESLSTSGEYDGAEVLIEARPARTGDGAVVVITEAAIVDEATSRLRRRVVVAMALGLLAATLVGWLVARQLGRPLASAAGAARDLAAGQRDVPLPSGGPPEVADVTAALGSLDEALRTSEAREREFLLSVSHELRTPLTAIRGYAEAMADGMIPPDEHAEVGRSMLAESERMERYVADLLRLARMEADDFTLDLDDVDAAAVVETAAAAWTARAEAEGVTMTAETVPVRARTDADRLRQVIDALADNAVRVCAAHDDGTPPVVVIAARPGPDDDVVVEVRDSGPGLTADDAAVAFRPGALHERYAGSRPGGHGLGLAIVHRLVTRLGGTIAVGSAQEGGAGFTITLPRP